MAFGLACVLAAAAGACNASIDLKPPSSAGDSNDMPTAMEHEACDGASSGAEKLDSNGDGAPDIISVRSGGKETCRIVDLNHDGRPDSFVYLDPQGQVRRRESDFDRDGKIDEIATLAAGVVVRKDRETNLDGKLDTWDFYEGGNLVKRSRDTDGDGHVDQWWTWADPAKPDCAVIVKDRDGDGKPDPGTTIDLCATAQANAAEAGTPTAPPDAGAPPPAAAPAADNAAATPAAEPTPPDAGADAKSTDQGKKAGK